MNNKPRVRTERLTMRLTPAERAFIEELAKNKETTITQLILDALRRMDSES